jgi:hypothetical protein
MVQVAQAASEERSDCFARRPKKSVSMCPNERPLIRRFIGRLKPTGRLEDPFGHHWSVATQIRDVSPEELQEAAAQMCG